MTRYSCEQDLLLRTEDSEEMSIDVMSLGSRASRVDALAGNPVDLLVVGGGIVGAGVARDAAMRGLSTLLIDRYDFAFGTSSRSSRLLHGGLRYLAQGRIGLVHEASTEKVTLSRIAPHLAKPLPFIFPTYKRSGWPKWKLRIGVKIYDWLCGGRNLGRSGGLKRDATLAALPGLATDNLTGAVRYFDGFTNDARLVLDTLRSAAAAGASLANYTSLESAERGTTDGLWHCRLIDSETDQRLEVQARAVVNAAGAWANRFPAAQVRLRLTKGIHVVVDRSRLHTADAVVMIDGKRILFVIPWGERTILGTTDTDYDGPLESPDCTDDDVGYVLGITNRNFPAAKITRDDVISAWSGLRPLIADPKGRPSDVSRAHQILAGEAGWLDVAGGKLTTYRLMAEQTVDRVEAHLNRPVTPCRTADEPILPDGPEQSFSGVVPPAVSEAAVRHYCEHEWARHLDDVMIRRTGWRYYHRDHLEIAERVASWMAAALDWSAERTAAELSRYREQTRHLAPAWVALPTDGDETVSAAEPVVPARAAS
jgi:glycerol-3-phosphate dehydrogenase